MTEAPRESHRPRSDVSWRAEVLDLAVGLGVRLELSERELEHLGGSLVASPPSEREREVRDHFAFVLFLAELAEHRRRLLEQVERGAVARAVEGEREVVERERFRAAVAEIAKEGERYTMLLRRLQVCTVTPETQADSVGAKRLAVSDAGRSGRPRSGRLRSDPCGRSAHVPLSARRRRRELQSGDGA